MLMFNLKSPIVVLWAAVLLITLTGCPKDDPAPTTTKDPIASFQAEIVDATKREVKFTNASQNATSYKWDFGDGTSSTEKDPPNKVYAEYKTYTVKLTVTGDGDKTSEKENKVALTEPKTAEGLAKVLQRTWKLARVPASLSVQPSDFSASWWAIGADDIPKRPCLYNHEYIFGADNSFEFKANGSFWLEGKLAGPAGLDPEGCADEAKLTTIKADKDGAAVDIAPWKSAKHKYDLTVEDKDGYVGTLKLTGNGSFLGLPKAAGDGTKEATGPVGSTTYKIKKLVDGKDQPDTLEVHYLYDNDASTKTKKGSWKIVLVSFDGKNVKEPSLGKPKPAAKFSSEVDAGNNKLVKFTNTSTFAVKYEWNFGDGSAKKTVNNKDEVSHTYASAGTYDVELVAFSSDDETDTARSKVTAGVVCTAETAEDTTALASLNLTFKTKTSRFVFGGFDGITTARISNPVLKGINMSCWVHSYVRANDAKDYGGSGMNILTLLNDSINFSSLSKKGIKMKVYSSKANTKVQIRLEKFPYPNVNPAIERTVTMTKTDEWEEITFNFSDDVSGNKYRNFLIYFDKGTTGEAATYYFDDIQFVDVAAVVSADFTSAIADKKVTFTNTSANGDTYAWVFGDGNSSSDKSPVHTYASYGTYSVKLTVTNSSTSMSKEVTKSITLAAPSSARVLETFEGSAPSFGVFNGAAAGVVNNPAKDATNGSDKVMQLVNSAGGRADGGTTIAFATSLDWSKGKVITFKARVPRAGKVIKVKVEGGGAPVKEVDITTQADQAGKWVDFRVDFTGVDSRATTFVLFADFLTSGTKDADTYFFDDFKQVAKIPDLALENFEGAAPTLGPFEGATVTVENNTVSGGINTSAKVMKFVNSAGGRPNAGTTLTPTTGIDWTKGKKLKFKAYVPAAGKVIKIKFEGGAGVPAKEIDITTQADQVNKWVELSADFTGVDSRATTFVIFADFLTSGTKNQSTYYFDDFKQTE